MKIVIDTNILVSAFIFGGAMKRKLARILDDEQNVLLVSQDSLEELTEVLFREEFHAFQSQEMLEVELSAFLADTTTVPIEQRFTDCRDPKDNKFLDLAVNGKADVLISGDKDLLVLNPFHGVKILTMTRFLSMCNL